MTPKEQPEAKNKLGSQKAVHQLEELQLGSGLEGVIEERHAAIEEVHCYLHMIWGLGFTQAPFDQWRAALFSFLKKYTPVETTLTPTLNSSSGLLVIMLHTLVTPEVSRVLAELTMVARAVASVKHSPFYCGFSELALWVRGPESNRHI